MDRAKVAFLLSSWIFLLGLSFSIGLYSGYYKNFLFKIVRDIKNNIEEVVDQDSRIEYSHLQPNRGQGNGVTINERSADGKLIFIAGFFDHGNELRLIERDGTVLARWPVSYNALFPDKSFLRNPPQGDSNTDIHGALIEPDGSLVFNFEYAGTVKLSRCGETVWTLRHPTHHSVEKAEGGGYWIPGRVEHSKSDQIAFPPFSELTSDDGYKEELILLVSNDGEIINRVSVPRILYENGLEVLMTAGKKFFKGRAWDGVLTHLNKIAELSTGLADAFPDFDAGDLALSLRRYNLILVVDPDDWRVKWYQTGPWLRQHDPEFNPDGTLTVFNNNAYRIGLIDERTDLAAPRTTNIIRIDPVTRETEVVFGERPGQEMLTVIRGKHDPTPAGGFVITEFEAGRVIEIDVDGRIIWEYVNQYDAENVAEVTEARIYPRSYFTVPNWTCP